MLYISLQAQIPLFVCSNSDYGGRKKKHGIKKKSSHDDLCVSLCNLMRCNFCTNANFKRQEILQEKQGGRKERFFPQTGRNFARVAEPQGCGEPLQNLRDSC